MNKNYVNVYWLSMTKIDIFFSTICFMMIVGFVYKGIYILEQHQALFSTTSRVVR